MNAVVPALLNHLWQSTLFAVIAGLLTLLLRHNGAHTRFALWCAASCKFLIPFSALVALGEHILWRPVVSLSIPTAVANVLEPLSVPAVRPEQLLVTVPHPSFWMEADLLALCVGLWACGAVAVVAWWSFQWLKIQRATRRAAPLRIDAPIPARSSSAMLEPGVVGFFRPVLLLPAGITERLSAAQLRAVVLHEICHVRRRDNLTAAIHMLVEALFWFHPLVWWLGRRMIVERECACDEAVVGAGGDPKVYAEGILQVCRHYVESPLSCTAGVGGADLLRRIEFIMTPRLIRRLGAPRTALLMAAAAAVVLGPIAVGSVFAAAADAVPETPPRAAAQLLRDLLQRGQYADLDQRINGFQKAYEARALDEAGLLRAFAAFEVVDPALAVNFDGWVKSFPRSYAAHLARGTYYFTSGTRTRGTKTIDHTTQVQLAGMALYFAKAQRDLTDSLALTAKPLLSYNVLIRMQMMAGSAQETRTLFESAIKIDPTAMSVRRAYMRSLQSRWGGSLSQMQAFMTQTRKVGFTEEQLWTLEKLIDAEHQWQARQQGRP
ncbi:MAG TPA: M56 family metallopeptidase [Steroidobacteraceae bacterium]|nr:M56 family metallopeptidase [Steroidobacteraceae bacterium]